jgi:phosphoenolpyruvate synthase/pyruvate phosphate dikinase
MDVATAQQRRSRHWRADVLRSSVRDLVLWLGEPACHERARVGGKAATLSRLAAAYRVPPGFCLTTASYALAQAGGLTREEEGSRLPALPVALYDALATAYRRLADRAGSETPAVAVRSSAVDEDGGMASYAGQHETSLNIVGVEAVADAVVHCWRSAQSPRARAYRRAQGRARDNVQVAVLVQQLIVAGSSAVLFSAHPVTGSRDEIVINASWGLGESIVGGTVTPDTYVVRKADLAVVARHIADKRRMTVAVPGGTREVDVPRVLRTHATLTEEQAVEIAHLGLALEATLGRPVDVECLYQAGRLHLLQCRPITTLPGCRAS